MTAEESFTNNLATLRKASGKTQAQVATDLNVNRKTYQHWEVGVTPSIAVLTEICRYFDVTVQDMLTTKILIR